MAGCPVDPSSCGVDANGLTGCIVAPDGLQCMPKQDCTRHALARVGVGALGPACLCVDDAVPDGLQCVCAPGYVTSLNEVGCMPLADCLAQGLARTVGDRCSCVKNAEWDGRECGCAPGYALNERSGACQQVNNNPRALIITAAVTVAAMVAIALAVFVAVILKRRREAATRGAGYQPLETQERE